MIRDVWKIDFPLVLAGGLKVVVLEVDGRGVQGRGEGWRRKLVGRMGEVDVEDHLEAVK